MASKRGGVGDARGEVMMLLHKAAVSSSQHGHRALDGSRRRPGTAYVGEGGGAVGTRAGGRPQTAVPRARRGAHPDAGRVAGGDPQGVGKGSLDGWLRSVGLGLVEVPMREPPKRAPEPANIEEQEGRAWRRGDKVLLSRAPEGARAKLKQQRAREQQDVRDRLLREGESPGRTEELYFPCEEGLDRYVWAASGKVLGPFERVERDAALEEALAQERRRRAGPGRPEDAWRAHGKAAWVVDCVGEEHVLRCEGALRRGCLSEAARKRGSHLLGTKAERSWRDGGKVLGEGIKVEGGSGLLLDNMERLKKGGGAATSPSSTASYAKELQPQRKQPIVEVFDKPWRAWGHQAKGKAHGQRRK